MRKLICRASTIAVLLVCAPLVGPAVEKIQLGIAELEVVRNVKSPGEGQNPAFGVIVRIYSEDQKRESFAISDKRGLAFVPLRPGKYCLEAFDDKGSGLELDPAQAKCFDIERNESPTIGVALK